MKTETDSRDAHGGQGRIKTARFPARNTLEEFDFLAGKENVVLLGPPGTGMTHPSIALGIRACLAGHRVTAAAMIDRRVHHAEILALTGVSAAVPVGRRSGLCSFRVWPDPASGATLSAPTRP